MALQAERFEIATPRICLVGAPLPIALMHRLTECALQVSGTYVDIGSLPAAALAHCDVVVVSCTPDDLADSDFCTRAAAVAQACALVAVVSNPDGACAVRLAQLGAAGLVGTDVTPLAFERTIRAVRRGEFAAPRGLVAPLLRMVGSRRAAAVGNAARLTPRQRQIVELIARGARDAEIAQLLGITRSTAHKHVQNARRRLNAKTRSELVAGVTSS